MDYLCKVPKISVSMECRTELRLTNERFEGSLEENVFRRQAQRETPRRLCTMVNDRNYAGKIKRKKFRRIFTVLEIQMLSDRKACANRFAIRIAGCG